MSAYLEQALELAEKGRGRTSPNPAVGAVVVRDNEVVSRGFHTWAGVKHAEVLAIEEAGDRARGSTMYVTLEPCLMCASALKWARIDRLVYGAPDAKAGYSLMQGLVLHPKTEVTKGVLENECGSLVSEFFKQKRQ